MFLKVAMDPILHPPVHAEYARGMQQAEEGKLPEWRSKFSQKNHMCVCVCVYVQSDENGLESDAIGSNRTEWN